MKANFKGHYCSQHGGGPDLNVSDWVRIGNTGDNEHGGMEHRGTKDERTVPVPLAYF